MRALMMILLVLTIRESLYSQQEAVGFAMLQLTGLTEEGAEITAQSQELAIKYEDGFARGALAFATLSSPDPGLSAELTKLAGRYLIFEAPLPEGKFAFGDSMEEVFESHGKIILDDHTSEFDITFTVSNMRMSENNIFQVLGKGRLSLEGNFNLPDTLGVYDSFTFVFTQNLKIYKP